MYLALFAGIYLVTGANTHNYVKNVLGQRIEFNTNTYTSKNRQEFKMYLFPRVW